MIDIMTTPTSTVTLPNTIATTTSIPTTMTKPMSRDDIELLLDTNHYPIGAFTIAEYTCARNFFYSMTTTTTTREENDKSSSTTTSALLFSTNPDLSNIHIGLQLYERLLMEIQYRGGNNDDHINITTILQEEQKKWICDLYQTIIPLLKEWKRNYDLSLSSLSVANKNHKKNQKWKKQTKTRHSTRPTSASARWVSQARRCCFHSLFACVRVTDGSYVPCLLLTMWFNL